LGRSPRDLIRLTQDLHSCGVELESLTGKIDTVSPTGKLVFNVFAALAEFERYLIRERTLAGLKLARARDGNVDGRRRSAPRN
jgi:DNA invertase Pin-like site-specific DNA recombinase